MLTCRPVWSQRRTQEGEHCQPDTEAAGRRSPLATTFRTQLIGCGAWWTSLGLSSSCIVVANLCIALMWIGVYSCNHITIIINSPVGHRVCLITQPNSVQSTTKSEALWIEVVTIYLLKRLLSNWVLFVCWESATQQGVVLYWGIRGARKTCELIKLIDDRFKVAASAHGLSIGSGLEDWLWMWWVVTINRPPQC